MFISYCCYTLLQCPALTITEEPALDLLACDHFLQECELRSPRNWIQFPPVGFPSLPHSRVKGGPHWHRIYTAVSGLSGLWRRGCELHPGGMGLAGPWSEETLQRCDAGDLQEPGLYRWGQLPPCTKSLGNSYFLWCPFLWGTGMGICWKKNRHGSCHYRTYL